MSKSSKTSIIWGTIACILTFSSAYTQIEKRDFAPYCSLYYKASGGPADILVGEIKPTISAPYTYYNVLTWSGGYTGLQMTEQGPGFIFSLWDPPGTEAVPSIRALYAAPGARVGRFGGEGTGLHYMNTATTWDLDHWYRFVVRSWNSGAVTYFALWVQDEQTGAWTHHVTMEAPEPHFRFGDSIQSFLEDWYGNGNLKRAAEYRFPRVRSVTTGWSAITKANFQVSQKPGASSRFARSFNTGGKNGIFFLQSGGDTKPNLPDAVQLIMRNPPVSAEGPGAAPDVPPIRILRAHAERKADTINIYWSLTQAATPQFAYHVQILSTVNGQAPPLGEQQYIAPDPHDATLKISPETKEPLSVTLTLSDIFDHTATVTIPVSE